MRRLGLGVIAAAAVAALVPALGVAAKPVVSGHFNFTSDPYADNICGVDVVAIDRVVETYKQDASGASIDNANVTTTYTAATGKSVELHLTGVQKQTAPIDNGDGTLTFVYTHSGGGPIVKAVGGGAFGQSTGTITFLVTADAAAPDHWISFQVLRASRPDVPGVCDAIMAYLLDP